MPNSPQTFPDPVDKLKQEEFYQKYSTAAFKATHANVRGAINFYEPSPQTFAGPMTTPTDEHQQQRLYQMSDHQPTLPTHLPGMHVPSHQTIKEAWKSVCAAECN